MSNCTTKAERAYRSQHHVLPPLFAHATPALGVLDPIAIRTALVLPTHAACAEFAEHHRVQLRLRAHRQPVPHHAPLTETDRHTDRRVTNLRTHSSAQTMIGFGSGRNCLRFAPG